MIRSVDSDIEKVCKQAFGYVGGYQKHGWDCGKACVIMLPDVPSSTVLPAQTLSPDAGTASKTQINRYMGNTVKTDRLVGKPRTALAKGLTSPGRNVYARQTSIADIGHSRKKRVGLNVFHLTSNLFASCAAEL